MLDAEGAALLAELTLDALRSERIDYVGGLEMGAVPIAGAIAQLSFMQGEPIQAFFVRKKPKEHGAKLKVEGLAPGESLKGKRVVIVEDVTTTGGSAHQGRGGRTGGRRRDRRWSSPWWIARKAPPRLSRKRALRSVRCSARRNFSKKLGMTVVMTRLCLGVGLMPWHSLMAAGPAHRARHRRQARFRTTDKVITKKKLADCKRAGERAEAIIRQARISSANASRPDATR